MTQNLKSHWISDFWGALASMLVVLPSAIAFGIAVYSTLGSDFTGQGASAGLIGAALIGIITPFVGRTTALISTPCAPAAAVLTSTVSGLLLGKAGIKLLPEQIPTLIVMTIILAGIIQILFGLIGGGRLIKFIPYQVVSGYLSGVALIIATGQLPKFMGLPKKSTLLQGLLNPQDWQWHGIVVGAVTIVVMVGAPKLTKKIPGAILGLLFGILTYFCLGLFYPQLLNLNDNALIIGPLAHGQITTQFPLLMVLKLDFSQVWPIIVPAITLATLLSIDTLKTCVALDALTKSRHLSDRELIGQGLGNLFSGAFGGMAGAGAMGPTLINLTSGASTPWAGIMSGLLVLTAFLFLKSAIAWVPIASLAGILLVIAWRMFDRNIFKLLFIKSGRMDFVVIIGVITVALTIDLIAASGFGVLVSIILFLREQIRSSVIRRLVTLSQISSKTQRQLLEKEVLSRYGAEGLLCELQGNLFFGTTDQLFSNLEKSLKTGRFLLFDLRRVRSMDYTAVHIFDLIHQQLSEKNGNLLFSGMPSGVLQNRDLETYLREMGLISGSKGILVFDTMDGALEWMEEQILAAHGGTPKKDERPLELKEFHLFREFNLDMLQKLSSCVQNLSYIGPNQKICGHGDIGDQMFLVRKGSVKILLPLGSGKYHHIATVGQGGFFGELTFLDKAPRSADVVTKGDTELYVLSRALFDDQSRADPKIGAQVFARLAIAISNRLRSADAELRLVEDR